MKATHRVFLAKLFLAAFLCGQILIGASQAIAGEAPSVLDETWVLFDDNSDDTDFIVLTLSFHPSVVVSHERKVYPHVDERWAQKDAIYNHFATGPPIQ